MRARQHGAPGDFSDASNEVLLGTELRTPCAEVECSRKAIHLKYGPKAMSPLQSTAWGSRRRSADYISLPDAQKSTTSGCGEEEEKGGGGARGD